MLYSLLADLTLLVHFGFILFVALGGLLVLRWHRVAWLHLPMVTWGVLVELMGWYCPLTPLENHFRRLAGEQGYQGDFIQHYLLGVIYPNGLTRGTQVMLGLVLLAINMAIYARLLWRRRRQ